MENEGELKRYRVISSTVFTCNLMLHVESQSSVDEDEHDSDASTSSNFLQPESGDTGEEEAFNTDLPAEHTVSISLR